MSVSLVSLNICGLSKLESNSVTREWLLGHDIVALQETLHLPHRLGFEGFTIVDEPAREQQGDKPSNRRSGGVAILLANSWLGASRLEVIVREWFLIAIRIIPPCGQALLLVNVYVPLHSSDRPPHLDALIQTRLDTLTSQHASDATILCGDWNGDLFRLRAGFDRKFLKIDTFLRDSGFARFPTTRQPFTFRQERRRSTIDYIFTRGLQLDAAEVAKVHITNHRPLRCVFRGLDLGPELHLDQALGRAYPRSPNSLARFEHEIKFLSLSKAPFEGHPEAHYEELTGLFEKYLKRPIRRPRKEGWEARLPPSDASELASLRSRVDELEIEYEAAACDTLLHELKAAKVKLERRTAFLRRVVADSIIAVRFIRYVVCRFIFIFLFSFCSK